MYFFHMTRKHVREDLLNAGFRLFWQSGYEATGIREIVAEAGAPQGCFTNYFRSKVDFAREILERYFVYVSGIVQEALEDKSLTAAGRLRRYLDVITGKLEESNWARGCMIGNFSLETSPHSEHLRGKLSSLFEEWRRPFAECIAEGQALGELSATFPADELADFLLASWQGAILRMKVERGAAPLERFKSIAFKTVFKEGP